MKAMRVLIMTASIGSGHIKAAEALEQELREQVPEAEIHRIDFMERRVSLFNWLLKRLYLIMLGMVPDLYDVFYRFAGGTSGGWLSRNAAALVMYVTMRRLLRRFRPDMVICTHPFPEGAASMAKRLGGWKFLLAAVLTDYSLHQIWVYPKVDLYFTATEQMQEQMRALGYENVYPLGIPLSRKICQVPDRETARNRLQAAEGVPVVLLMGGGLGLGGMEESMADLERVEQSWTILVIAGRNDELQERVAQLAARSHHRVRVWGYTDQVHLLMQAADIIITKPGALTMSESFALGLPLLLHEPIPGPEEENAVYASRHGAAVWIHEGESIALAAKAMLGDADRLEKMHRQALWCARPQAAKDIVLTILKEFRQKNFFA